MSFLRKNILRRLRAPFFFALLFALSMHQGLLAQEDGAAGGSASLSEAAPNDATRTGAYDVREDYRRANKLSIPFGPPTRRNPDGLDEIKDRESLGPATVDHGPGPVYAWPVVIPTATSSVPSKRDLGITKNRLQTFGMPISDTQYQMIHRMDQQIMLEEMFDPERVMWLVACVGTSQVQDTSNSFANVTRNQCASAIDYVSCNITNFTVDKNNRWNKIREQLFMPMALLLLLPGAVLAQVKVVVAAGMPIGGSGSSPFEGIIRSIIAIFLIPATYLLVNYGIDLNNSLTYTISHEYERIFASNMYKDALCMVIRAFPIRQSHENRNGIYKEVVPWKDGSGAEGTPAAGLEARSLKVKVEDPCSGEFKSDPDRADEQAPFLSVGQRFITNSSNAVLAMTWNILCAFQVVFLMYLWLVGPIVAALWVYPHETLRGAFPGWVEGVLTLCFWALFWNTTVLLMACFKGVDSTGSIIASALLFLSVQSVKSAFDFAGLVKEAGQRAGEAAAGAASHMSDKAKPAVAGGGGGQRGGSASAGRGGGHASGVRSGTSSAGSSAHLPAQSSGSSMLGSLAHAASGAAGLHVSGSVSPAAGALAHMGLGRSANPLSHPEQKGLDASPHKSAEKGSSFSSSVFPTSASAQAAERSQSSLYSSEKVSSELSMTPPLTFASNLSLNNSNSSSFLNSSSYFSSSNSTDLTASVQGLKETYSAREAAFLLGQNNLANFPRDGAIVNREQALLNFNQAMREVEARNGREGSFTIDSQKRNDLMASWKKQLEEADRTFGPDASSGARPDNSSASSASENWNLQNSATASLPQGFEQVFSKVSSALSEAAIGMSYPTSGGVSGLTVNPQAAAGLAGLAQEITRTAPHFALMTPQHAGATIESWQQRSELYSQQLYQQPASSPEPDSYSKAVNSVQQARYELFQFQQNAPSVAAPAGNPLPPISSNVAAGQESFYSQALKPV
ncbi:MAG: hypothetical protein K2X27_18650, partial [Candidatus Obscuribacterales bacterium]|nr:hypothetical protein [Candidatus Obscuribacterales bacterium]